MPDTLRTACRAIVISDLHLGGDAPAMMSSPARLAGFIDSLPALLRPDERLELVIAGDIVDFLAITPSEAWTGEPAAAREKLLKTIANPPFGSIFEALGRHLHAGHLVTLLLGNHDLELAFPAVHDALLTTLQATPHQVHCLYDGRAYRIGRALIEHGNRYDGANENDWDGLRTIVSAQSRGEAPPLTLKVSPGSYLVERVVSALKGRYPFIDLLQPQGELLALLLAAFEPGLVFDLPKIGRVFRARRLQDSNARGLQPARTRAVAVAAPTLTVDPELRTVFGPLYDGLMLAHEEVNLSDVFLAAWNGRRDGLAEILRSGGDLPQARLVQIREAMRRMLQDDASDRIDGETQQYGHAAQRIIDDSHGGIDVVLMGHTHLPRHIGPAERATYINCGTWTDVIRVPRSALEDGHDAELQQFLRHLLAGELRSTPATYADLRIERDGQVTTARLTHHRRS